MNAPIIEVKNLSKSFKLYKKEPGLVGSIKSLFSREYLSVEAVRDVSFTIERGEFVGFIGSNGAGKTTTLKMLSGLLYPTTGTVNVMGYQPWQRKREYLKRISLVMGQKNQLWWDLPAIDSFMLNKEIYEIPDKVYKSRVDELIDILDIGSVVDVQVRKLSLGQRMKCELVSALLHDPTVLFLDEPTIGLDVLMQKKLRNFFKDYNTKYETSVMLTSHYMDDVKELCKRVIVISSGVVVYDGSIDAMIRKYASHKNIHLLTNKRINKRDLNIYGDIVDYDHNNITLSVLREDVPKVSGALLMKFPIEDIDIKELELDEIVRRMFTEESEKLVGLSA